MASSSTFPPEIPDSFDWRNKGVITPVRNQHGCQCCWAIVAAGAIESIYNIKHPDQHLQLSPQNLVDCMLKNTEGLKLDNAGCHISTYIKAFKWIQDHGIFKEEDYPFIAKRGPCRQINKVPLKIESFNLVKNMHDLNSYIFRQPLAARMRVTQEFTNLIKDEIYFGPSNADDLLTVDLHGVLIVGYGKDEYGNKFWTIKNSWGETWGDKGYARVGTYIMNTSMGPKYLLEKISYPNLIAN